MAGKTDNVSAHVRIINGVVIIDEIKNGEQIPKADFISQLMLLRDTVNDYILKYEAEPIRRK